MENNDTLLRRAEDLAEQCGRRGIVTASGFLTPAERYQLEKQPPRRPAGVELYFFGGRSDSERTVMFCLPDYILPEYFEADEYIKAIHITAHFGAPGHRDYMGAILGMGIERDRLGDILVKDREAWFFCLPGIFSHLLTMDKVGRFGVTAKEIALADVPAPERHVREETFSVMSPRLDAVVGGMFRLSRSEAAKQVELGKVSVNYAVAVKTDLTVREGDIISLQGHGKAILKSCGGMSRKGRLFLNAEVLL